MKNRRYLSILAGIAMCFCLASATATYAQKDRQMDPKKPPVITPMPGKTALTCVPASLSSDVAAFVEITNNTGQTIPSGTVIYWQTVNGLKGDVKVSAGGLKPNAMIKDSDPDWTKRGNCSAYYYKK